MQSNLDATEKEEVLADAIAVFIASKQDATARASFICRLVNVGFPSYFADDTLSGLVNAI